MVTIDPVFGEIKENKLYYRIICTVQGREQFMLYLSFDKPLTEDVFLLEVDRHLTFEEKDNLMRLDCCQLYTESDEEVPMFLMARGCQYRFVTGAPPPSTPV